MKILNLPSRWRRMDLRSRMAVVEVGRALRTTDLLDERTNRVYSDRTVGLIAGTRWGSLSTDLAFCETLAQGPELASPILFSYTLANIALAEAASHFRLTGPVYSVFADDNPMDDAVQEAVRWLSFQTDISAVLAGELDIPPAYEEGMMPTATFRVII